MKHTRLGVWSLGLAAGVMLSSNVAVAQPEPPHENHYEVYSIGSLFPFTENIVLVDQLGVYFLSNFHLEMWSNPAEKILPNGDRFPPVDPIVHQMWWRGDFETMAPRDVVMIDQFGTNTRLLINPEYLLTPALKNVPGGNPPTWNHYLCYRTEPEPMPRVVTIVDQFGQIGVQLEYVSWFCNPVEKWREDGRIYPIVDAKAHLACYVFSPPPPMAHPVIAIDQFGNWQFDVRDPQCLCVPALAEYSVKTEQSTWGKIKAMYR